MHSNCINLVVTALSLSFFANRVINALNNLPTSVRFTSSPAFSRTIRSVDFFLIFENAIAVDLKAF